MKNDLKVEYSELEKMVEFNADGIMVVDNDGFIVFLNTAAANMFGSSKSELLGQQFGHPLTPGESAEIELLPANGEVVVAELRTKKTEWEGKIAFLTSIRDITERKHMEEKLKEMSIYDSLTGLYNRNFFEEEMKRLSDGRHHPLGIIVADLDGLKFINDALGHQVGDRMLINAAEILKENFRSSDIIARIGGDEFAVLLTNTGHAVVKQIMNRLGQGIQDFNNSDLKVPLSLSLGYALNEGEGVDMHALFRDADNRMYRDKLQHAGSARSAVLHALSASMQARDFDAEGHCDRLQVLCASLARPQNLAQDVLNELSLLARFHDLGKIGVPDHILFKPGPLSDHEWRQMRQHCEIGHRIASSVSDLKPIADHILKHHEWWDGRGYPLGLSGEDIPLPCRILAIVDAYDAMTSDRPYRKAMAREKAIAELKRFAGMQFDPELVEQFIQILKQNVF